jgi:hypothetical protein
VYSHRIIDKGGLSIDAHQPGQGQDDVLATQRFGIGSFSWTFNILLLRSPHAQNTSAVSG